jgi:hypothetical protein
MSLQNRETLKNFFRKGQMPSEGHFNDLIESMLNKVDDGLSKTIEDGLTLSPMGASQKLISFFKSIEDKNPAWRLEIDSGDASLHFNNQINERILTLNHQGKIGINQAKPKFTLDVNGVVGMKGREGSLYTGTVKADGNWHAIITDLNGCHAFEVMAGAGKKRTGKYALVHAFAISTFGSSRSKIQIHQAYYGVRCNKIDLRWSGSTYRYNLEMRTRCSYGDEQSIRYHICNLWSDPMMDGTESDLSVKANGVKQDPTAKNDGMKPDSSLN